MTPPGGNQFDKTAIVDPGAQLRGCTVIGRDCRVGGGAILEDTNLWPNGEIAFKSHLESCIVRSDKKLATAIETSTSKMMRTELLRQTRMHFPRLDVDQIRIRPIQKGGSDRKFYQIRCLPEQTLILVKYNLEREENRYYVQIARFLDRHGIRVPKIYFHDATEGLIWIEDLGDRDLFSYRNESWLVRRAFYESALDQIAALHGLPESVCIEIKADLPAEFNAALYFWEQNYFFENCLGRYFAIDKEKLASLAALPTLNQIAEDLDRLPRVLVHRDFQSQNIIMRNGQAHLIDFQGMRPGLAEYDLASLLYDPYVDLADGERAELIDYYREQQVKKGITIDGDFDSKLRFCAMQRLMQALGAYGFLGLIRGHKHFLTYVPVAMKSLRSIVRQIKDLEELEALLGKLIARS
jgi:aminoglycoside/choline kinase family phosphotransferase